MDKRIHRKKLVCHGNGAEVMEERNRERERETERERDNDEATQGKIWVGCRSEVVE